MPSTPAEIARTLATGRRPGRLSVASVPDDIPVAHATTAAGRVLIAARRNSRAWLSLMLSGTDSPAVLAVDDEPPFADSPHLGRVRVGGWVTRVSDGELAAAAVQFAEANPLDDLLDLGTGVELFGLELGEVRLERPGPVIRIEPDEFMTATADPLHADERELLQDLRDHHVAEIAALVPGSPRRLRPVRLDRYGLVVALPGLARLEFAHPACGPCCVARALRLNHTVGHRRSSP